MRGGRMHLWALTMCSDCYRQTNPEAEQPEPHRDLSMQLDLAPGQRAMRQGKKMDESEAP
jgi:hypothetical protein